MKHTEFGHSITFIAQNWDVYPDFTATNYSTIGNHDSDSTVKVSDRWHLDKNTWESWHLIPESRPTLPLPKQKTKVIDSIPNTNGQIDLSLKDIPYPVFENREGTFTFIYNPIYSEAFGDYRPWIVLYSEMAAFLHGRELRMVLEDDPGYYWQGRFSLESWESNNDGSGSTVTIGYSVYPYKRSICTSIQDWLWDPFNFYNGVIPNTVFNNITIDTNGNWTGFNPHINDKKSIISILDGETDDSRWYTIDLYQKVGNEPLIPIVWWKPNINPGLEGHHDMLVVNYVNNSYGINYENLGKQRIGSNQQITEQTNKYKYYDPKKEYNDTTVVLKSERVEGSGTWFKFVDKDLIFCDAFMGEAQYIRFIGEGIVKIEFRRGML